MYSRIRASLTSEKILVVVLEFGGDLEKLLGLLAANRVRERIL